METWVPLEAPIQFAPSLVLAETELWNQVNCAMTGIRNREMVVSLIVLLHPLFAVMRSWMMENSVMTATQSLEMDAHPCVR